MIRLIAGGYAEAGATGLYPLHATGDRLAVGDPVAAVRNVSAGIHLPGSARWLLVDERAGEIVLLDADDDWREVARLPSGGAGPCHLALDAGGRRLAVAHYDSGTTAVFDLAADGCPIAPPRCHRHDGSGPVPDRQQQPHAHWVGFDATGTLYVTDLGSDRVLAFDPADAPLAPRIALAAPPGSGPRQIAFHPRLPIAYLVSELASTLAELVLDRDLVIRRIHDLLPAGADRRSLGGAIVRDGDRIHVSNRGHDSIATFAIASDGSLSPLGHRASGGRSPRFLLVHADHLFVAHEQAGGVTMLPLDADRLPQAAIARADVPGAAFLGVWE